MTGHIHSYAGLIADLAHDLRSPLTSLQGFSSTLLRSWDRFGDEQRREFVETISHDARRMGRMITEIVDLARVEEGRLELKREPVDLSHVVNGALAQLAGDPQAGSVALSLGSGISLWADEARLISIVTNLIERALRDAEDGGSLEITTEMDGGRATLRVSAPGLPVQEASPPSPGEHDYGIYLASRLTRAHGGTLAFAEGGCVLELPVGRDGDPR